MIGLVVSIVLLVICILILYQLSRGAVFMPTQSKTVAYMVELASLKPGMRVADLGSGDGRIVIAMAQAGASVVGFELNPILGFISRRKVKKAGLSGQAEIKIGDFWNADLSEFDVVTLFGIDYIMNRLEKKLQRELKNGSLVISNAFRFPTLPLVKSEHGLNVYRIAK